jgi:NADPH:quinone reductase
MKALVYEKVHSLADFAIKLVEIPAPTLRENDVLVDVRAIGVNPGEAAIRSNAQRRAGRLWIIFWRRHQRLQEYPAKVTTMRGGSPAR